MSINPQRQPTRFDTQTTKVQVELEHDIERIDEKNIEEVDLLERGTTQWEVSDEKPPRFSIDHSESHFDQPFTSTAVGGLNVSECPIKPNITTESAH